MFKIRLPKQYVKQKEKLEFLENQLTEDQRLEYESIFDAKQLQNSRTGNTILQEPGSKEKGSAAKESG